MFSNKDKSGLSRTSVKLGFHYSSKNSSNMTTVVFLHISGMARVNEKTHFILSAITQILESFCQL